MLLVSSPTSPFARKVRVIAHEAGITLELANTNPFASDTEVVKHNPLSKVPTLIHDGTTIVDSPVICAYLDSLHPGTLIPEGASRWPALRLQALADGMMDATVLRRLETLRPVDRRSDAWIARQVAAIRRTLDVFEADAPFDACHVGSIAVACALGYLDHRFAEEKWREGRPQLATWYAAFAKRPSMVATAPPT